MARDQLLDQHQVSRVVLYVVQGTKRRAVLNLRLGNGRGKLQAGEVNIPQAMRILKPRAAARLRTGT